MGTVECGPGRKVLGLRWIQCQPRTFSPGERVSTRVKLQYKNSWALALVAGTAILRGLLLPVFAIESEKLGGLLTRAKARSLRDRPFPRVETRFPGLKSGAGTPSEVHIFVWASVSIRTLRQAPPRGQQEHDINNLHRQFAPARWACASHPRIDRPAYTLAGKIVIIKASAAGTPKPNA